MNKKILSIAIVIIFISTISTQVVAADSQVQTNNDIEVDLKGGLGILSRVVNRGNETVTGLLHISFDFRQDFVPFRVEPGETKIFRTPLWGVFRIFTVSLQADTYYIDMWGLNIGPFVILF